MQTLLSPVTRAAYFTAAPPTAVTTRPLAYHVPLRSISDRHVPSLTLSSSFCSSYAAPTHRGPKLSIGTIRASSPPISQNFTSPNDETEKAKLLQVTKRLESTARYFKRLGSLGFWGQLVSTVVAAVILSFSVVITGKVSSPPTFLCHCRWDCGGIHLCVFGHLGTFASRISFEELQVTLQKAPPRADVIKSLKNGIVLNILGMGAAVLGMQATVGLLVAKALTSSANPYQGLTPGYSPVLALDVFLVQASANTILSHFLGLLFSLELLRSVTLPPSEGIPIPRFA